jgi:hypothetical protein
VGKKKKHSEATPSIASVSINTQLTQRTKAAPEIPLVHLAAQRGARKTTIFKKTTPLGRQPDNYPLPRLEDLLHSTGDTVFTSTVDLKAGYCRDTFIGSTKILLRLKVKNPPILYTIDTIMTHKILLGTMEVFPLYLEGPGKSNNPFVIERVKIPGTHYKISSTDYQAANVWNHRNQVLFTTFVLVLAVIK